MLDALGLLHHSEEYGTTVERQSCYGAEGLNWICYGQTLLALD